METIVFDPEAFKPVVSRQRVRCECGHLQGDAEVIGVPKGKRGGTEYKLSYAVTGMFYHRRDELIICIDCHKPALSYTAAEAKNG